jgi:hypothetical protein
MVADSRKDWKKADSFYEIAAGPDHDRPQACYNNWGFSKLTRGDFAGRKSCSSRRSPMTQPVHRQEQPGHGPRRAAQIRPAGDRR